MLAKLGKFPSPQEFRKVFAAILGKRMPKSKHIMRWQQKPIPTTPPPSDPFRLDTVLLRFGNDTWTVRDSFEGTVIMGQTGSGKTTGSGAALAKAFLHCGYGGLVLCAKPGERQIWEQYAAACGRENHLVIFSPHEDPRHKTHWRFNFLDYELRRSSAMGGGLTENLVHLFSSITEIVEGKSSVAEGDNFWERAMRQLLRNAIDLLNLAWGTLTLTDIVRLVLEAPKTDDQTRDEHWQQTSFCALCLREADRKAGASGSVRDQHDFETVWNYWTKDYAALADRTKTSIVATFTSIADILAHGHIHQMLSTTTNICPEITFDGAIILLDLPIQHYHAVGRIAQGIFKYMFQRAVLARDVAQDPRPLFLWADEAQNFVASSDYEYQAVARSARCATVYLTQNISLLYAVLGSNGRDGANALLGNFATKIFHANGDVPTNTYAADLIGQHWTTTHNYSASHNGQGSSTSGGGSDSVQNKILPSAFTTLRRGGPPHRIVEGIIFQGGRIWQSDNTFLKVQFRQSGG
jgi:type IV secretory pathway TraG/TraD family ATPase VirD4